MSLPQHIAIIMDGNGKWASRQNLNRSYGHQKGAEVIESIVLHCKKIGIKYLTLYAFSTENWKRNNEEINNLFDLMRSYFQSKIETFVLYDIKITFIGAIDNLPNDIVELMQETERRSIEGNFHLIFAINYGGRQEIITALKKCGDDIDNFENYLYTGIHKIPDPDLLIRTGGECRISNFLLWQIAYTELLFLEQYWPDIRSQDLDMAVLQFQQRIRKYGK